MKAKIESIEHYALFLSSELGELIILIVDLDIEPGKETQEEYKLGDVIDFEVIEKIEEKNVYKAIQIAYDKSGNILYRGKNDNPSERFFYDCLIELKRSLENLLTKQNKKRIYKAVDLFESQKSEHLNDDRYIYLLKKLKEVLGGQNLIISDKSTVELVNSTVDFINLEYFEIHKDQEVQK